MIVQKSAIYLYDLGELFRVDGSDFWTFGISSLTTRWLKSRKRWLLGGIGGEVNFRDSIGWLGDAFISVLATLLLPPINFESETEF